MVTDNCPSPKAKFIVNWNASLQMLRAWQQLSIVLPNLTSGWLSQHSVKNASEIFNHNNLFHLSPLFPNIRSVFKLHGSGLFDMPRQTRNIPDHQWRCSPDFVCRPWKLVPGHPPSRQAYLCGLPLKCQSFPSLQGRLYRRGLCPLSSHRSRGISKERPPHLQDDHTWQRAAPLLSLSHKTQHPSSWWSLIICSWIECRENLWDLPPRDHGKRDFGWSIFRKIFGPQKGWYYRKIRHECLYNLSLSRLGPRRQARI